PPNGIPAIVDVESSHQKLNPKEDDQQQSKVAGSPKLTLPNTTLMGGKSPPPASCPVQEKMDEAIAKQQDLLAEFDKIADELNRVLANLEGSTLVKRLKAESRLQNRVAGRLGDLVGDGFGVGTSSIKEAPAALFKELSNLESKSSLNLSNIMD